jgi:hypothetical protein
VENKGETIMFQLQLDHWSFNKELQIIHADVILRVEDMIIVEEPLCVDVGLPALLVSIMEDVEPNRWAPADQWRYMPFFVCGCGDPDCRAFSFVVRHRVVDQLDFTWVEERKGDTYREMESFSIPKDKYREQVMQVGRQFMQFIEGLDYRPYFADTVAIVEELMARLEKIDQKL